MKKKLAFLLACCLMVFSLAACSSSSESEDEEEETEAEEAEEEEEETEAEESEDSDLEYILEKGTLVVGITDFEPMDYKDEDGNWIGFDADLATLFAEYLGVEVEFVEIEWDNKILEIDAKSIDCVWNGMTLTDEVTSAMSCSNAYLNNAQIVVLSEDIAEDYTDVDSLSELAFAVETGSSGEAVAEDNGFTYTAVSSQANALLEVASGTADAAIIDSLMAAAMIGEGTSYEDLTYTISLSDEEYGVGFRTGSDLVDELNTFLSELYEDGTLAELAETYGVSAALIEQ